MGQRAIKHFPCFAPGRSVIASEIFVLLWRASTDEKIYVIALNSFRTIATPVETSAQLFL